MPRFKRRRELSTRRQKRTAKTHPYRGENLTVRELVERSPHFLTAERINDRLARGFTVEESVNTPVCRLSRRRGAYERGFWDEVVAELEMAE